MLCCKILHETIKIKSGNDCFVERGFPSSGMFRSLKCELCGWNFKTDAQVIQETQSIFGYIPKEKFETTI